MDQEFRMELFKLKIKKGAGQLDKPHQLRATKKDIARVRTKITQLQQNKN